MTRKPALDGTVMEEIFRKAQVMAFRDCMEFARRHGWEKDFPEASLYDEFKRLEQQAIEVLKTRWIIEHGSE